MTEDGQLNSSPGIWIIFILPNLALFSITAVASYFWHEIYRNFEDSRVLIQKYIQREKKKWIVMNGIVYSTFLILSLIFVFTEEEGFLEAIISIIMVFIVYGAFSLLKHGIKLSRRVKNYIKITGKQSKSFKGFFWIMALITIGCVVKLITLGYLMNGLFVDGLSMLQLLTDLNGNQFNAAFAMAILSAVFGELGIFVSLIFFLNAHKSKEIKSSIAETAPSSSFGTPNDLNEPFKDVSMVQTE